MLVTEYLVGDFKPELCLLCAGPLFKLSNKCWAALGMTPDKLSTPHLQGDRAKLTFQ